MARKMTAEEARETNRARKHWAGPPKVTTGTKKERLKRQQGYERQLTRRRRLKEAQRLGIDHRELVAFELLFRKSKMKKEKEKKAKTPKEIVSIDTIRKKITKEL